MTQQVAEPYVDSGKASAFLGVASRTLNELARKGVQFRKLETPCPALVSKVPLIGWYFP
jgi:hypothetical protein